MNTGFGLLSFVTFFPLVGVLGIAALSKSMALDMSRYKVTSNCIAPFAWSRMIGTIPDAAQMALRAKRLRRQ